MLRIGVDVGGTHTDAVLMDGTTLCAATKAPTTTDIGGGVVAAMSEVLRQAGVAAADLKAVMIGTTQFTNAVVEGRRLNAVGVLRIGLPAASDIPPMLDWPPYVRNAFPATIRLVRGGVQFDGRDYAELDETAVRAALDAFREARVEAVAVSQVFAPVRADAEKRVVELAARHLPGVPVTLSHSIGRLGLIERENAAILNAALAELARQVVEAFLAALPALGITAPLFISQNDGTLMTAAHAQRYPVLTFASGPTNSMRGAAHLTGIKEAIVVDVGGTTSDVGVLRRGFPRESSLIAHIGGVRTNFRMPDVLSVALGGGSEVRCKTGHAQIGPGSVGHALIERARVFGGDVLTLTDVAVAAGRLSIGEPERVADLPAKRIEAVMQLARQRLTSAIDGMRRSAEPLPVIMVGGGSQLVPDPDIRGGTLVRPPHSEVANAIGAAIAQVSGEVDRTVSLEGRKREDVLAALIREAGERAEAAGADKETLALIDQNETPLQYLPGDNARIQVRVAGNLRP